MAKLFDRDARRLRKVEKTIAKVEKLADTYAKMSDEQIQAKTPEFRKRLANGETLDDILPEAFAAAREATRRVTGKYPYHVQLMGGVVLHNGDVAEMSTGEGKAVPVNTPIPTPEGWKIAGDIKAGDYLFGRDGKPAKVIGVYPQGKIDTYQITLRDGRTIKCAADHLWSVYKDYNRKTLTTMRTEDMYKHGADNVRGNGIARGYQYHLPVSAAVEYPERDFKISPYIMGVFLGDGCKNPYGKFELSTADVFTAYRAAKELPQPMMYIKGPGANYTWNFYREFAMDEHNKALRITDVDPKYVDLLSKTYCSDKYIPEEYKISSIEQRWALIQGMMDADGNIYDGGEGDNRYNLSYSTTSEKLRDDFMEVLYSLGISCSWGFNKLAGEGNAKHDQYTIHINVPHDIKPKFFSIPRKLRIAEDAATKEPRNKDYSRIAITKIEKLEEQNEQVCYTVDTEDHLFLVGEYVVTHNTITAVMPVYLNALEGKGVHVVTVNEYLSERDAVEMGRIYSWLGLSVGLNRRGLTPQEKQAAYNCDITYTTNSEVGFDYLRDNMVKDARDRVQRGLHFALVDEVDSILIDESRTPLIISGGAKETTATYLEADAFVKSLKGNCYEIDERGRNVVLTDAGIDRAEKYFKLNNLYSIENAGLLHRINQALRANKIMKVDVDYVVDRQEQEIIIVDPNTGRLMKGREWSDGLHQAVEAKEGIEIKQETVTKATITYQNFFRMYDKLAGMTGTAKTEEEEFREIYNMLVYPIPTNRPVIRKDYDDAVYGTKRAKYAALIDEVKKRHATGQPILVGTIAVETSELISKMLQKEHIPHEVLNAKNHAREAEIIAKAGQRGAVTIATNMAGRGTDIKLGEGVAELGGLCVLGSERHESRRIDNQLRGRSGRQGDPGESRFFVSVQDDLMVRFGSERMEAAFKALGDEKVESRMITKQIGNAQKRVEGVNYDARKNLLKYDDVMRMQREMMYGQRNMILDGADITDLLKRMFKRAAEDAINESIDEKTGKIDETVLKEELNMMSVPEDFSVKGISEVSIEKAMSALSNSLWLVYKEKVGKYASQLNDHERKVVLTVIDDAWTNNIDAMDKLRQGISYRSYAQENPLTAYMDEGFKMFDEMAGNIAKRVLTRCMRTKIVVQQTVTTIPLRDLTKEVNNAIAA